MVKSLLFLFFINLLNAETLPLKEPAAPSILSEEKKAEETPKSEEKKEEDLKEPASQDEKNEAPKDPVPSEQATLDDEAKTGKKLPLPRYVSLRGKTTNMHVGPGKQYPVDWQYVRPEMPMEIIAEFDTWRQVQDHQGTQGWIHKSLLSGKRTVVVTEKNHKLFKDMSTESKVVASLEPGVIARVHKCQNDWCQIEVSGYKGWMKRRFLWGIYPHETNLK